MNAEQTNGAKVEVNWKKEQHVHVHPPPAPPKEDGGLGTALATLAGVLIIQNWDKIEPHLITAGNTLRAASKKALASIPAPRRLLGRGQPPEVEDAEVIEVKVKKAPAKRPARAKPASGAAGEQKRPD